MADGKMRVGIIGMGVYAAFAHIPQLKALEQVEITAISRRNPERLTMAQKAFDIPQSYTDWRKMLDQVSLDAVVVSTPHHLHYEPTIAALQQGLHVLVEKPMALTSREAWAMVKAAEAAQRVLMVGYPSRLQGLWQTVKQTIASNTIGRVRQMSLSLTYYCGWTRETGGFPDDVQGIMEFMSKESGLPEGFFTDWGRGWRNEAAQMGGGTFVDNGTHHIDRMLWLAGAPAVELVAMTDATPTSVERFVNVQARLANDVLFSLTSADAVPQNLMGGEQQLMIVGDEGIITDDSQGEIWLYHNEERKKLESQFRDRTVIEAFVDAILGNDLNYPQAFEGAYAVDFMEALYRSAAEHKIIRIKDER